MTFDATATVMLSACLYEIHMMLNTAPLFGQSCSLSLPCRGMTSPLQCRFLCTAITPSGGIDFGRYQAGLCKLILATRLLKLIAELHLMRAMKSDPKLYSCSQDPRELG